MSLFVSLLENGLVVFSRFFEDFPKMEKPPGRPYVYYLSTFQPGLFHFQVADASYSATLCRTDSWSLTSAWRRGSCSTSVAASDALEKMSKNGATEVEQEPLRQAEVSDQASVRHKVALYEASATWKWNKPG